jgi:O-antigen ligase
VTVRLLRISPTAVATALLLAALALVSWEISASDGFGKSLGPAFLLACAVVACFAILLTGPVGCLIAVSAVQIVGFMPVLVHVGRVDFTLADVFYVGLAGWWLTRWALGQNHREARRTVRFGERTVLVFLAYVGVSSVAVLLLEPGLFATSTVSWIRLVQTASLAWLAASVIRTVQELRLLINALALAASVSIGVAIGAALLKGGVLSERYGGMLGPNQLGLVSGLLIVLAVAGGTGGGTWQRLTLSFVGALGLVVSKSQGALLGTALVIGLAVATSGRSAWFSASRTRSRVRRLNRLLLTAACAGVVGVSAIHFLRPGSLPTSSEFHNSSVYARIIVGAGGLELFSEHPFFGVGWRRSESPALIASSDLAAKLRRRFPAANESFYPDVQATSVHNTYIQLLAELGLVGAALFGVALCVVGRRIVVFLRSLRKGGGRWRQARFFAFRALLSLVWLNDNPLYGGQPETVLLALTLGSLVALARMPVEAERLSGFQPERAGSGAASRPSGRLESREVEVDLALKGLRALVGNAQREIDAFSEKLDEPSSTVDVRLEGTSAAEPAPKRRGLFRRRGRGRGR